MRAPHAHLRFLVVATLFGISFCGAGRSMCLGHGVLVGQLSENHWVERWARPKVMSCPALRRAMVCPLPVERREIVEMDLLDADAKRSLRVMIFLTGLIITKVCHN